MIALILAAALCANPTKVASGTKSYDGLPPARYSHLGTAQVSLVPADRIDGICGAAPCPLHTVACTIAGHVYLPDPVGMDPAYFRDIVVHEFGHAVGGWPSDHPK